MLQKIQGYDFKIKYRPGHNMTLADTLSRLPSREDNEGIDLGLRRMDGIELTAGEIYRFFHQQRHDDIFSDNGPQYTGKPYRQFTQKWGIQHNQDTPIKRIHRETGKEKGVQSVFSPNFRRVFFFSRKDKLNKELCDVTVNSSSDKISEDLLVSKALIEIGANEACRDLLNAGDEFEDFSALSSAIAAVCKLTNAVFTIHDCQTIAKANRSRCVKVEPLDEKFKYKYVKYVCKQFGYSRRRTVPGIRPNQKTYKTGCPALIAASVDREKQRMVIRSINLNHSHQMLGHMYPENRRQSLSPNVLTETYRLIDIGMKTKNIREYICNVTGKQLTTRDINNLKAKRKKELSPPLNHNTSNMVNHNNNNIHNNNNNINNNNNNIINCNDGHTKKKKRGTRDMEITSPISSHVFDISKGLPATGVPVLLFIQIEKRSWKLLQKSLCSK
ncbi:DDB_G0292252 [Octopus vulgaris]|uniref:DDB_G0292252 n=1 Tax=Octopus vulgaris TaxID=6645 RepID=A0AA36FBN6_OCTVU|nr:DDB_G0292252 [Octopus vulgaris]